MKQAEILATPSLAGLIYALRHPETWPPGFKYYWGCHHSCGMGLAYSLWPRAISARFSPNMAKAFGVPSRDAHTLFLYGLLPAILPWSPKILARRLEKYQRRMMAAGSPEVNA